MTENNQKRGKKKNRRKRQNKGFALSISYSYTQRFKGNSRDKTKKKRIRTGKKKRKGSREEAKSPAPRRPFVFIVSSWEVSRTTHSDARSPAASAAVAIAMYGVYRMSWYTSRIILQRERIFIQSVVPVWAGFTWSKKKIVVSDLLSSKKPCQIQLLEEKKTFNIHINLHLYPTSSRSYLLSVDHPLFAPLLLPVLPPPPPPPLHPPRETTQ